MIRTMKMMKRWRLMVYQKMLIAYKGSTREECDGFFGCDDA